VFLIVGLIAVSRLKAKAQPLPSMRLVGLSALTGFLGYGLSSYLDFKGLEFISAQLERLVLFTYPLFVMFLGALWFRQRVASYGIWACGITYAGLAIVFGMDVPEGGWATIFGTVLVLGCAVTFAINQLMAKTLIGPMGSVLFTSVSMLAGGTASLLLQTVISGRFAAPASRAFLRKPWQ
jgi:drug/metabolite transporter (DMT)-like permease